MFHRSPQACTARPARAEGRLARLRIWAAGHRPPLMAAFTLVMLGLAALALARLARQTDYDAVTAALLAAPPWRMALAAVLTAISFAALTLYDFHPTGPALAQLPQDLLQCIHGRDEKDSACPALERSGAEVIETKGGHHFDGDYRALAAHILDGLDHRVATGN